MTSKHTSPASKPHRSVRTPRAEPQCTGPKRESTPSLGAIVRTLSVCMIAMLTACGGIQSGFSPARQPADGTLTVRGDWDDTWAAGQGGAAPFGWVIVAAAESTPTSIEYELLSVRDEIGAVRFERSTPADEFETEPVAITLSAGLGRFGDPELEALMLASIAQRLVDLRGSTVSTLPIREFDAGGER